MNKRLQRNIWLMYLFSFFWLFMIIIPVIVPFFESKGLSLAQVFYLQAIFATCVVVFEIPSGYVADMLGRKNALVAGSLFHGVGFTLLYFVDDFQGLVLFELSVGIGLSLLSGADLSLLYDSQVALNQTPRERTSGIASLRFIKSTAEGIAALVGGVLVIWSLQHVVVANAIFAWGPLLLSMFLVEAPYTKMARGQPVSNVRMILSHLFLDDRLLRLICLNTTLYSLSTFYVVWLMQPYWQSAGVPLAFFGLIWAAQSFLVGVTGKLCLPLEDKFGPKPVLVAMAILPVLGYIGMATLGGLAGIALGFSFFLSRGLNQVILTDALNRRVPSNFRATANSLTSFLFRLMFIVTGPLVGLLVESQGIPVALMVLGGLSALLFPLVMKPMLQEIDQTILDAAAAMKDP